MRKIRVLALEIYKPKWGDCSNGGISSKYDEVLLECSDGYMEIDLDNPPPNFCVLEKRMLWGEKHYFIRPYAEAKGVGWMYGGCIVDTSDSRYAKILGETTSRPLHLHDRTESQEMYDMLSR